MVAGAVTQPTQTWRVDQDLEDTFTGAGTMAWQVKLLAGAAATHTGTSLSSNYSTSDPVPS